MTAITYVNKLNVPRFLSIRTFPVKMIEQLKQLDLKDSIIHLANTGMSVKNIQLRVYSPRSLGGNDTVKVQNIGFCYDGTIPENLVAIQTIRENEEVRFNNSTNNSRAFGEGDFISYLASLPFELETRNGLSYNFSGYSNTKY